jgi:hypothetical protein
MRRYIISLLACFLLLFVLQTIATACCDPPCGDCESCVDEECVDNCDPADCCGGSCCYNECCNDTCCASGEECCGECCDPADCCGGECCTGRECCNNTCCPEGEICCNGTCCDPADCCNNDVCCNPGDVCCDDLGDVGVHYCCPGGTECCKADCCKPLYEYCSGNQCRCKNCYEDEFFPPNIPIFFRGRRLPGAKNFPAIWNKQQRVLPQWVSIRLNSLILTPAIQAD